MKVMVDIGHPAHVHFFKNTIRELEKHGHFVKVTARDKDVTLRLLEAYGIPYLVRGSGSVGTFAKGIGMISTDVKMLKIARKFKPDITCGILNPYAAQISRLVGAKSITFTDTEHAKSAQRMTFPFTDQILTPSAYHLNHGRKQIRYKGYHELAYLHPKRFTPNPSVLDEMAINKKDKYAIIRFVSWQASHDVGHKGFSIEDKIRIVKEIEKYAVPIITSEAEIPNELRKYQMRIPPHRIHDALYYATLYMGEGATMASEAAVLGIPGIYTNNLKVGYVDEEEQYGLIKQYSPESKNVKEIIQAIISVFESSATIWKAMNKEILSDKIDVTAFMVWFVENYPESASIMKENPEYQNKFIYSN